MHLVDDVVVAVSAASHLSFQPHYLRQVAGAKLGVDGCLGLAIDAAAVCSHCQEAVLGRGASVAASRNVTRCVVCLGRRRCSLQIPCSCLCIADNHFERMMVLPWTR